MTKIHFGHLYPSTLGFDRVFNTLEAMLDTVPNTSEKFPPHNIIKLDDQKYVVELAVAGFNEDEITITVEDGVLKIEGEKQETDDKVEYLHIYWIMCTKLREVVEKMCIRLCLTYIKGLYE